MKLIDRRVFGAFVLMLGLSVLACAQPASSSGEYLLVLNKAGNDLTILNPADYKVLGTIKVGDGPHEIVVTDDGSTAYVTNYGGRGGAGNSLSVIDIKAMKETKRVDLGPLYRPHGIK
ncbi:MAG: hypothetical protein HKN33_17330, partial [Pyrinomonadaceae bacterium]|nr:hypothetical protein [Pyrinomonadaceae bacterium]